MALSKPVPLDPSEELRSLALIAARDTHSLCVMCLGLKHAQEAIDSQESCSHCLALPKKLRRRRQRVAATHGNDLGPEDFDKKDNSTTASRPLQDLSSLSWADRSDLDMSVFPLSGLHSTGSVSTGYGLESTVAHMPQTARADGLSLAGFTTGVTENEGLYEVGFITSPQPVRDLHRRLTVRHECTAALRHWENTDFFTQGTPLGVLMRKVVTTDASLSGWGATEEGRVVNGMWPIQLRSAHINYLELLTIIWIALRYFLPRLRRRHVLVRCDNVTAVAYVNRQGGMHSLHLHSLAHRLLV
ncbi:hypothetical protein SKAU_G00280670 [Synaphobranchus kaupii]|uniref:Reverse transcriptase RNase H-like domain-containing protein n=1 Tax=Synaphobranchus kaupii TaxID=118154 RepID=A0A9Q1EX12_SYNKA|nr:hypothetical protein SKAU_G00280670 [Synaphobranchus kaupii]